MTILKEYLGDSVYAAWDGWHFVLTTENGMGASNTIFLDFSLVERLGRYVARTRKQLAKNARGKEV